MSTKDDTADAIKKLWSEGMTPGVFNNSHVLQIRKRAFTDWIHFLNSLKDHQYIISFETTLNEKTGEITTQIIPNAPLCKITMEIKDFT